MYKAMMRSFLVLVAVGFLFVLGGCGSGGSLTTNPADEPATASVSVPNQYQVVEPDGKTIIPVTVYVFKGDGSPANDVKVEISADPDIGTFDSYSKSTQDGKAVFYYTVPSYDAVEQYGENSVTINVTVAGTTVEGSTEIYFKVYTSKLVATIPDNSTILPADSDIVVPVTVYAFAANGRPVSGVDIFATATPNIGSFDSTVATTSDQGVATFNYRLPSRDDADKAQATSVTLSFRSADNSMVDNVTIAFDNVELGNGVPSALLLSASPSVIYVSGISAGPKIAQVTARVVDSAGNPIYSGYEIRFSLVNAPYGTYISPSEVTLKNGTAIANVVPGSEAGTVLVKAEVVGYPSVAASSAIVNISAGEPSKITLTESGRVEAQDDNGTRSIRIFALVKDADGTPVPDGTVVYFSLYDTCGGLLQPQGITSNGVATATLVYPGECIWKGYTVYAETSGGDVRGSYNGSYPAVAPVSLALSGPTSIGPSGGFVRIYATLKDENGDGLPIGDTPVRYSSSADNVTFTPNPSNTDANGISVTDAYIPPLPAGTDKRTVSITGQAGSAIGTLSITQSR